MARLAPCCPKWSSSGVPVSIDTIKAKVARLGARARRGDPQRRLGPAARSGHGARRRRARRAGHHHAQPRQSRSRRSTSSPTSRHSSPVRSTSPTRPAFARDAIVLDPGIGFGKTPEQSMTAIAQLDAFKDFGLPLLVGASRKRFIDTVSPSRPISGSAARSPRTCSRSRTAPPSSAPTTWPKPSRRCGSHAAIRRQRNDRPGVRQRLGAARLSRRDAARGQGRPDLQARSHARHRSRSASRSDKLADTVGYDQVVERRSEAFRAKRYRLVEAAAGAVAEAVLARVSPRCSAMRVTIHKPHAPIAATFDDVGVSILRSRQASRTCLKR